MEQGGENENFSSADLANLMLVLLRDDQKFCKTMHTNHQKVAEANNILLDLKKLIKDVPILADKLTFPEIDYPKLKILVNECLDSKMNNSGNALKAGTSGAVAKHSIETKAHDSEPTKKKLCTDKPNKVTSKDILPTELVWRFESSSNVTSMDFHPLIPTYLLVGTDIGDITLWSILDAQRRAHQSFRIWSNIEELLALKNDSSIPVKKSIWNHDGSMVGVAFSKRILELYYFRPREGLTHHLEIDAHLGIIHDISFLSGDKRAIASCGEDKAVKIWSVVDGHQQFICNSQAPILSVCPKEDKELIWFADEEGNIKRWLYTNYDPVFQWNASKLRPGVTRSKLFYHIKLTLSGDRLFSCGSGSDGYSHLAEWDVTTKKLVGEYCDLARSTSPNRIVHFDMANNFVVSGDYEVKFWAGDHSKILLKSNFGMNVNFPVLKLNRRSFFLAVSADKSTKILANFYGKNLIKDCREMQIGGIIELERLQKMSKIDFKGLQLPDPSSTDKVVRLMFASSGSFVVGLLSNDSHKIWNWNKNDENPSGVATAHVVPQLWSPEPGSVLINETIGTNLERTACCALTKNDQYICSASGGRISIFILNSFKVLMTLLRPPPAATCLAIYPNDNNVIAIGMEDSSIKIYDIKGEQSLDTLKGHQNWISGLAFSQLLNILVSASADAQLCSWSTNGWRMEKSRFIQHGRVAPFNGETYVQFNKDGSRLLVVLECLIAVYDGRLDCLHTWVQGDVLPATISSATFSCDGLIVYATFCDGGIAIFDSDGLKLDTFIVSNSYLPSVPSSSHRHLYPTVVAAHPTEPNQIAFGMNNGAVYILQSAKKKRFLAPQLNKSLLAAPRFFTWLSQQDKPP